MRSKNDGVSEEFFDDDMSLNVKNVRRDWSCGHKPGYVMATLRPDSLMKSMVSAIAMFVSFISTVCCHTVLSANIRQAAYPPAKDEQSLQMPVYLALQPMRCAAPYVTIRSGELLPRLFTLTGLAGGYFLSHLLCRYRQLPVRKHGALRCPDFPPAAHASVGDTIGRAPCSPALSAKIAIFAYVAKYYG